MEHYLVAIAVTAGIYAILASDGTVHVWNRFGCDESVTANVIDFPSAVPAPAS